jgi:ketosteroid isomerase-like protein
VSQENVDTFRRAMDAYNRGDTEALLNEVGAGIEWHPLLPVLLGGPATVYRGHVGVVEGVRELDGAFAELRATAHEVRDLGARVLAIGELRGRGKESGATTDSKVVWLVDFENGKVLRVREFADPSEALEAAGLAE